MTGAGIDRLLAHPERLPRGRVALLTNQAALTAGWEPTVDALRRALGPGLVALLSPEHGASGFEDDATDVPDRRDAGTGLPLVSLYGPRRRPDAALLDELDAVVVDLQEVGVRCYTYATTVALLLEAVAAHPAPPEVVVCDRPNLLGGRMDGPALDPERRSFLGYLDVPYQHGLTLGELARDHAARLGGAPLRVEPVPGWRRDDPGPPSGAFVPPSPGLPDPAAVALYPGLVLLEGTPWSEGRGTPLPFRLLGGPTLDGDALASRIRELAIPGLAVRPLRFRPDAGPLAGRACSGVQLHVLEPRAWRPLGALVRILRSMHAHQPIAWTDCAAMPWSAAPDAGEPWHEPARGALVDALTGDASVRQAVEGRAPLEGVEAGWGAAHRAFLERAEGALLYRGAPRPLEPEGGA